MSGQVYSGRIVTGRLSSGKHVLELLKNLPIDGRVMLTGEITDTATRVLFLRKEINGGKESYCVDIYMRCTRRCSGKYRRGMYRVDSLDEVAKCVWHFVVKHGMRNYELLNLEGMPA